MKYFVAFEAAGNCWYLNSNTNWYKDFSKATGFSKEEADAICEGEKSQRVVSEADILIKEIMDS